MPLQINHGGLEGWGVTGGVQRGERIWKGGYGMGVHTGRGEVQDTWGVWLGGVGGQCLGKCEDVGCRETC